MSYKMSDEALDLVMDDLEKMREERNRAISEMMESEKKTASLGELIRERQLQKNNERLKNMSTMERRRLAAHAEESYRNRMLRPAFDPTAPVWCAWRTEYASVARVMLQAEERGFFKMKDRDRSLCNQIIKQERISMKQRSWLGGISLRYLQDGVYEGHTWWSRSPETNLIMRWDRILNAVAKPETTVEQLEEVTGSAFMARYQKVLAARS